jgi:hypothetical protein
MGSLGSGSASILLSGRQLPVGRRLAGNPVRPRFPLLQSAVMLSSRLSASSYRRDEQAQSPPLGRKIIAQHGVPGARVFARWGGRTSAAPCWDTARREFKPRRGAAWDVHREPQVKDPRSFFTDPFDSAYAGTAANLQPSRQRGPTRELRPQKTGFCPVCEQPIIMPARHHHPHPTAQSS